jgi:flagellar hook-length control protein FliK
VIDSSSGSTSGASSSLLNLNSRANASSSASADDASLNSSNAKSKAMTSFRQELEKTQGRDKNQAKSLKSDRSSGIKKKSLSLNGDQEAPIVGLQSQLKSNSISQSKIQDKDEANDISQVVENRSSRASVGPKELRAKNKDIISSRSEASARSITEDSSDIGEVKSDSALDSKDAASAKDPNVSPSSQSEASGQKLSMENFLSKMKSELGVEPEVILSAFASLDDSALLKSAKSTQDDIISQLGLDSSQLAKANSLYDGMLAGDASNTMSEVLSAQASSNKIPSSSVGSRQALNQTLELMNDIFSDRLQYLTEQGAAPAQALAADELNSRVFEVMQAAKEASGLSSENISVDPNRAAELKDILSSVVSKLDPSLNESQKLRSKTSASESLAQLIAKNSSENLMNSPIAVTGQNALSAVERLGLESANLEASIQAMMSGLAQEKPSVETGESDISLKTDLSSFGSTLSQPLPKSSDFASQMLTGKSGAGLEANTEQRTQNIQDLVEQTQLVIKKGGGEVTVQMRPEGMGQVQLKVDVENGKINVQLLTESKEAKSFLEKDIKELKNQFLADKINVQGLKIEVATDIKQGGLDSRQNHEQAKEQAKNFAQDFMNQFRDERQSWRQDMMSQNSSRGYREPKRSPIEPDAVTSRSVGASSVGAKSNGVDRRLNLVA